MLGWFTARVMAAQASPVPVSPPCYFTTSSTLLSWAMGASILNRSIHSSLLPPLVCPKVRTWGMPAAPVKSVSPPLFLVLLLAFVGAFLGALAVAGVALEFQVVHAARQERTRLAHPRHHLQSLPDGHLRHLLHERSHLVELLQELVDFVRFDAGPFGDAPPPVRIDDVRVGLLLLGHRIDHSLHALQ